MNGWKKFFYQKKWIEIVTGLMFCAGLWGNVVIPMTETTPIRCAKLAYLFVCMGICVAYEWANRVVETDDLKRAKQEKAEGVAALRSHYVMLVVLGMAACCFIVFEKYHLVWLMLGLLLVEQGVFNVTKNKLL